MFIKAKKELIISAVEWWAVLCTAMVAVSAAFNGIGLLFCVVMLFSEESWKCGHILVIPEVFTCVAGKYFK